MAGEVMSMRQVADEFDVTRRTVSRWVAEGKLPKPSRPTKGRSYFDRAEVMRILGPRQGGADGDDRKTA